MRDYDTSLPEFRGDREQLIQAVLNIAHNACQALAERIAAGDAQLVFRTRVARQVTFGKQRYRLALELHVIDNGPGVPDVDQGPHLLPAGVGQGRRVRPGADAGADLRSAAPWADRVRQRPGADGFQDPDPVALSERRAMQPG